MDYFLKRNVLNLFFPNRCPICNEIINTNDRFCPECTEKITLYNGNFNIDGATEFYASIVYSKAIMPALFMLKSGECGNSDYAFGEYLSDVLKDKNISDKVDFIVPVPMTKQSMRKRGYNQAELISKVVSVETGIPVKLIVKKVRNTEEQKKLGKTERKLNLKDSFEVNEDVSRKRILIIDDVCTTGSTFSEIAVILRKNGVKDVFCASAMKVLQNHEDNIV